VLFAGCMACLACYDIARRSPRANLVMIVLATAEIYGGGFFSDATICKTGMRADMSQAT
jgi:hypothetical protein